MSTGVTSILGALLMIGGVIIYGYFAPLPKLQTMGFLFLILGAVGSAVGAVLIAIDSSKEQESLRLRAEEISNLNKKIAELNEQIAGSVTGGDSFVYLFPSISYTEKNTMHFHLHHKGDYPVYDIFIRVWDDSCLGLINHGQIFEKYHGYRTKEVSPEEYQKMKEDPEYILKNREIDNEIQGLMRNCLIFQDKIGTITRSFTNIMDLPLIYFRLPTGVDLSKFNQEYSISIIARNGQYNQKITLDIRNKRWHIYSKVEKIITDSQRVIVREYESQDMEQFVINLIR